MKRRTLLLLLTAVMMVVAGFATLAFSKDAASPAKNSTVTCAKFVDSNHDGACDSSAVCHKDGTCQGNCKQGALCKEARKNGQCDKSKCAGKQMSAKTAKASSACPSMINGTCKQTGKVCPR